MVSWEKEIFKDELSRELIDEYKKLLSVKKSDAEAEKMVKNHFIGAVAQESEQEGRLWLALALREWQLGRLSQYVKEKALYWATQLREVISSETISRLLIVLNSPIPEKKKIRLPSYVAHCPWPVGSLLAYRIISSEHPHVTRSPYYKKYVLLRVIMVNRHPITLLAPDDGWHESMLVGLYDWIGDCIPNPEIADSLQFTEISITGPYLPTDVLRYLQGDLQSDNIGSIAQKLENKLSNPRIETCCSLDWRCVKGIHRNDVFTYLGCDIRFQEQVPPFFKTNVTDYALCHSLPFDAILVNRFSQLAKLRK